VNEGSQMRVRHKVTRHIAGLALITLGLVDCHRAPNPDSTIFHAYNWYVATLKSGGNPFDRARTNLTPFVTERFLTSIETLRSDLDSSALVDPQSFDGRIAIEEVKINGNDATARVLLSGRTTGSQALNVSLIKEEQRWKIDDVKLIGGSEDPGFD